MTTFESNAAHRTVWLKALLAVVAAAVASTAVAGAGSASAPTTRDFTDFELITRRNIFDPNRRPPPRDTDPPSPPRTVDSFTFSGTMSYSKGWFAFFDGTSSDYRMVAEQGETIAGHTIKEIKHDLVCLGMDTNEVKLTVGMQMRRLADGTWRRAEASSMAGSSIASTSRSNSGRFDRDRERGGRNREDWRGGNNGRQFNQGGNVGMPQMFQVPTANPTDNAGTEGLDIAEIMRRRRMQETGEAPQNGAPVEEQVQETFQGPGVQRGGEIEANETVRPETENADPAPGVRFRVEPGPATNDGGAGGENDELNGNDNTNRSDED